jgi:glutathione S-transferase
MSHDKPEQHAQGTGDGRPTPRITLYSFAPSQNAIRPELALREKGLEFEKVEVDLLKGEHQRPPLSELTPRGQVPTLVYNYGDHGDDRSEEIVVYESIATIRFIDDMHSEHPLMPPVSEPLRRAQALMRIEEFQAKLDPRNIFGSVIFGRKDRKQLGKRIDDLLAEIERWDAYTVGQMFLAGDQFTLADIAVFPVLMHFEALGYDYGTRTPALAAYIARCKVRPSVQASRWLEVFSAFTRERDLDQVLAGL